ncbi:transcriptional regulator [Halobacteriales archaeon QS_5_70_17]|jgi:predicted transcriptional regulator|nr:MAG: transcriptional regulator [Halobacteriales archaeon QS_5_70_17]
MSLFDVLGSKARLQILQELSSEPRYVSELVERVGMDGKTAVHHLSVLEEAGLVTSYRSSRRKYYRLVKTVELRAAPSPDRTFVLHAEDALPGDGPPEAESGAEAVDGPADASAGAAADDG